MEYTEIRGHTFSRLTLGTVALGMEYGISNSQGKPTKGESFNILSAALTAGINTIDTSREYGDAELLLGDFFNQPRNTGKTSLVTKFKITESNFCNTDKLRAEVYESIRCSLNNLRLQQLPVCLLHKTPQQPMEDVMKKLPSIFEDLKNDGLIGLAGISINHPDEAGLFLDHPVLDAIQLPVNIFDQRIIQNGMLHRLHLETKIVFARSVFLQGLFFMEPANLQGNLTGAKTYLKVLRKLASEADMSLAQLAFSFLYELKEITSLIFGATNEQQVKDNVNLLPVKPVPDNVKQSLKTLFTDLPETIITPALWSV